MERIVFKIEKSQEGLYLPLEIEVDDVEKLGITYSYARHLEIVGGDAVYETEQAVIDFSIIGPNGQFLGSSGSNRGYLFFSERESSVGFEKLKQMAGVWTILVGAYNIPDEGIEVVYEFDTVEKAYRWFKGDTHMHTTASDGQLRGSTLVEVAKDMGLDFIMMTDHNNYHPEAGFVSDEYLTVIPGVEWTQYNGHGNFLNVEGPLAPSFVTTTEEELRAMIQKGKDAGALFVLNHPFCPNVPWKWTKELDYDAIEVWNGGTDPRANVAAIEWWHGELLKGRRVVALGGSDFHRFDQIHSLGSPTVHVYAKSKSRRDILEAIQLGALYITNNVEEVGLEMVSSDGVGMGGVAGAGESLTLTFRGLKKGFHVKIIDDVRVKDIFVEQDMKEFRVKEALSGRRFVRVEVWDERGYVSVVGMEGMLLLVSNPVYVG
ncbi:CehA/McbA family metallohydrolase [Fundicoccus culcitae]|uniref:CehA/McbA family metallohydrolase n=1 Tax=Fundicoccus culcitae TaxID=2969821 RepID=A0ABY5P4Q2_9LACT|nr:CehA/McbA family metallohydrolase [Fundicoccus culcitae]UUX33360.1 CehA/McbA family metallohydrolase [Fundicoccus culcitae]